METQKVTRYAVPAMIEFIRDQWADEMAELLKTTPEKIRSEDIDLFALPLGVIRVELMDESSVEFRSAYYLVSGKKRAIAVLTEHCGYHVFPIHEAKIHHENQLVYEQVGAEY